jgi:hypothetical protein
MVRAPPGYTTGQPAQRATDLVDGARRDHARRPGVAAVGEEIKAEVERAVAVRDLSRDEVLPEVQRLDLLILGGGGILYDAEAAIYLREVTLAHERQVPVMVYAVSAGPLQDRGVQELVRDNLNRAAAVTVRERRARQLLEEIGVHVEIEITADPALLLEPEPLAADTLKREGLDESHRLIGLSVREPGVAAPDIDVTHCHALLANAADPHDRPPRRRPGVRPPWSERPRTPSIRTP